MKRITHVSLNDDGTFFMIREYDEFDDSRRFIRYYVDQRLAQLPDAKRLADGFLRVACSDVVVEALSQLKNTTIEFDDDAQVVYHYWLAVIHQSRQAASTVANFKIGGQVPNGDLDYGLLSPYQKVGLVNALTMPGYGLFMKQGTGKTGIAIMAIVNDSRRKDKSRYRAIVVCPPNVRVNWSYEFKKFAPNEDINVCILRGGQVTRLSQIVDAVRSESKITVMICNYETLQSSWDALQAIDFDYAILDEAHMIKSPTTKRAQYAHKLSKNAARRLVLTGTPIANNVNDLFSLFEFMGTGTSGFRTFEGFRKYFGKYRQAQHGDVFQEAQNLPILRDKLARYSFIISKEEALPFLPDKVYDIAEVEMTEPQREAYLMLRDELVMEIETTLENADNEAVAVNNILTQLLRLSQITSSFRVIPAIHNEHGDLVSPRKVIPFATNIKAEYVKSLIEEKGPNDKTIIWSNWVEDITAIEAALREAGENPVTFFGATSFEARLEAERKFNEDDTCRWFIGNPQAGGTGLNLLGYPPNDPTSRTTNCNHVIYVSQNWSAILREQSEDRAHRRGTREPVRITEVVVPNTIDTIIATRVANKRLDAASTLDIKEILNDIRSSVLESI